MGWNRARGQEIFDDFRRRPGSYQIASAFALSAILAQVDRRRPRRVLEFGPGIGATTRALVDGLDRSTGASGWDVVTVEVNEFCRNELATNLGADAARVEVVVSAADVPHDATYDFVLIDGPGSLGGRADWLSDRAVVFVENLRVDQRAELDAVLPKPWVSRSAWPVLTTEAMGGYHVYQLDPTPLERIAFPVRHRFHQTVLPLRSFVRRGLAKVGLGSVLARFERRADRGRISASEYEDATVVLEGD